MSAPQGAFQCLVLVPEVYCEGQITCCLVLEICREGSRLAALVPGALMTAPTHCPFAFGGATAAFA